MSHRKNLGFTAITFDDLAHLVLLDNYSDLLKETVCSCRALLLRAFAIATAANLRIFINTDLMFWNQYLEEAAGARSGSDSRVRQIFIYCLEQLFSTFPEVSGIVTRIGEAGGCDVDSPFKSRIWFRRLRVPPLLWIFWDTILVNQPLRLIFRAYLDSPAEIRHDDREERQLIRRLRLLSKKISVEQAELTLGVDTLRLLYSLRRFYLGKAGRKRIDKISIRMERYRHKHPQGFIIESDYSPFRIRWITAGALFGLLMRSDPGYRLLDRMLLIRLTGLFFPLMRRLQQRSGFVYDVLFAGIPYQDPTPELQAQYDFHSSVAGWFYKAGGIVLLLGLLAIPIILKKTKQRPAHSFRR